MVGVEAGLRPRQKTWSRAEKVQTLQVQCLLAQFNGAKDPALVLCQMQQRINQSNGWSTHTENTLDWEPHQTSQTWARQWDATQWHSQQAVFCAFVLGTTCPTEEVSEIRAQKQTIWSKIAFNATWDDQKSDKVTKTTRHSKFSHESDWWYRASFLKWACLFRRQWQRHQWTYTVQRGYWRWLSLPELLIGLYRVRWWGPENNKVASIRLYFPRRL